jgi:hypothetical protein
MIHGFFQLGAVTPICGQAVQAAVDALRAAF